MMSFKNNSYGFTLAELLISLAILGVIATFTIPKIITAQQANTYNSMAKEAAGTISDAYQTFKLNNTLTTNTVGNDFSPYLNYVAMTTTGSVDDYPSQDDVVCRTSSPCYRLHNGSVLRMSNYHFSGTAATNAIFITFDPDGVYSGIQTGNSKSVRFFLYYSGKIRTKGDIDTNTCNSDSCYNPSASHNPSWFSW